MTIDPVLHALSFETEGQGPPVILLHGLAASRYDWQSLAPALVKAGYQTYAVDLFGHGDSPKPDDPGCYHTNYLCETSLAWMNSLAVSEPPILVGHSLGGYLSLYLAMQHSQKIRGLILINPFYTPKQLSLLVRLLQRRPEWGSKALRAIPLEIIDAALGWDPTPINRFSAEARRQIAIDYKRASPHILRFPATIANLTEWLPQVTLPTLVIWGDKDLTLKPAFFESLVTSLPKGVGTPIHGAGHQPHIGQPDLVNQLVIGFLAEIDVDERHHPS